MTPLIHPKSSRLIEAMPFFYGWVILIIGTLGIVMMGPSQTFTVSIFIEYFIQDLGISRANIALIYGLATLTASFMLPITGRLFDRYGGQKMVLFTAFGLGWACLGMAFVQDVLTLLLGLWAIRFLGFGSLQLSSNNVIAQWFIRQRGLVMGFAGLSLGIGLAIYPSLAQYLIDWLNWRGAWAAFGLIVWAIMLPMGFIFIKDKPEKYGLLPDGDIASNPSAKHTNPATPAEQNWTLAEARRTSIFWVFAIALSTLTMVIAGLVFHQPSLFAQRGLSQKMAVYGFSIMAIFSVVGNLGMGKLLDVVSARKLLASILGLVALALLLVQVLQNARQVFIYGALLGLASGAFRVMDGVVWAKYYGRLHLGSIRGFTMVGVVGCTALGPYPLGLSFDYFGSYAPALNILLILPLTMACLTLFVQRPSKQA